MATGSGTGTQSTSTTTTSTAEKTLKRALRLIGVLAENETPTSSMYNDALTVWQDMYDSWSAMPGLRFVATEFTHTLVVGTASYTVGLTGSIVRSRPTDILNLILRQDGVDYIVKPMTRDTFYALPQKSTTARPSGYMVEQTDANLLTIRLDCQPDAAYTMVCYALDPFSAPTAIDDDVTLPPGYREAVVYNLAARLMPEYGISLQAKPEVPVMAEQMLTRIKAKFIRVPTMNTTFSRRRGYDIHEG